jgi:ParB family chromosome partitioning protein
MVAALGTGDHLLASSAPAASRVAPKGQSGGHKRSAIAEWIKITERISSQVATKIERGRPESGVNSAARELGIDKDDAHRAVKVASFSEKAKEAARATDGTSGLFGGGSA